MANFCSHCGTDIRSIRAGNCPECGATLRRWWLTRLFHALFGSSASLQSTSNVERINITRVTHEPTVKKVIVNQGQSLDDIDPRIAELLKDAKDGRVHHENMIEFRIIDENGVERVYKNMDDIPAKYRALLEHLDTEAQQFCDQKTL